MKLSKNDTVLCTSQSAIESDGTSSPIKVFVTDPILLEANQLYTIEADRTGPLSFYGGSGKSDLEMDGITMKYVSYDGPNNGTCCNMGQIPQVIISHSSCGASLK